MQAAAGDLGAREVIRLLNMVPHPEGGHYVETFRSPTLAGQRPASTLIHFLLQADEVSAWHRVDADEIWLWQAGGPLVLTTATPEGTDPRAVTLGPDLRAGHTLQGIVPAHHWQTAETLGAWTLLSCTVAPGFDFAGFELAPEGWRPKP
ncbi:MAG: cupin domain-containing protein [Rhodobacterales bacterium]|jgi:predicted cupin superfamily sugar epimerase|nr:cupin domain-containing protein [Rhodobacterales bacterium]